MHPALSADGHRVSPGMASRLRPPPYPADHDRQSARMPVAPNLPQQEFTASVPNRVRLADITDIPTSEGCLYLAAVLDLATREVVGWT